MGDGGVPVGHHARDEDGFGAVVLVFVGEEFGEEVGGDAVAAVMAGDVAQAGGARDDLGVVFSGAIGFGSWLAEVVDHGWVVAVEGV